MADEIGKHQKSRPQANPSEEDISEAEKQLKQEIRRSHEILISASTVWPFTLFPDTVTVDRAKLTVTQRSFFKVAKVVSIRVEDILNVTANLGPLFGSLHIVSRVLNPDKPYEINFLWRDDAMKIKRILQGYIIATQKGIDLSPLKTDDIVEMLDRLGKDDHPESR